MLINSVSIFLREALPCFLFVAILASIMPLGRWLVLSFGTGIVGCLTLFQLSQPLSALAEGSGLEWLQFICYLIFGLLCLSLSYTFLWKTQQPRRLQTIAAIAFCVLFIPSFANLLIYVSVLFSVPQNQFVGWVGSSLGLCVSLSVAFLLYLLLSASKSALYALLYLQVFCAGLLANATQLLEQHDWLLSPAPLWDLSHIIQDVGETGYLFNALIGYEATPSINYLVSAVIYLCLGFSMIFLGRHSSVMSFKRDSQS